MQLPMVVPLFFTMLLAPVGLLIYLLAIKPFYRERASKQE